MAFTHAALTFVFEDEKHEERIQNELEKIEKNMIFLDYDLEIEEISSVECHDEEANHLRDLMNLLEELNIPYDYKEPVYDGDTRVTMFRPKTNEREQIRIETFADPNGYREDISLDLKVEMHRIADILEKEQDEKAAIEQIKHLIDDYYKIKKAGRL